MDKSYDNKNNKELCSRLMDEILFWETSEYYMFCCAALNLSLFKCLLHPSLI
jgi:hypothetical protein